MVHGSVNSAPTVGFQENHFLTLKWQVASYPLRAGQRGDFITAPPGDLASTNKMGGVIICGGV